MTLRKPLRDEIFEVGASSSVPISQHILATTDGSLTVIIFAEFVAELVLNLLVLKVKLMSYCTELIVLLDPILRPSSTTAGRLATLIAFGDPGWSGMLCYCAVLMLGGEGSLIESFWKFLISLYEGVNFSVGFGR